jgi:DNA invertase Pin-like site-specific DNA recombinase
MIQDAQRSDCGFRTILVYDIKRFGRVDNDEAGHYRWLLRQAGVRVVYVAEGFGGGSTDLDTDLYIYG